MAEQPTHEKVVIFGNGKFAELACYVLTHDSPYEVVAFTVDEAYITAPTLLGKPVVPFERLAEKFPPESAKMLVALGYLNVNGLREARYQEAKSRGYAFVSYVSSRASVWPDLQIGENCMVYEHAVIQPFAKIGDNVIIRSSAHVSHHVEVGSHAFISAGVTIGGVTKIDEFAFIGLNATVRDNIRVASKCFIAAGAVLSKDTEPDGLYMGVPAKRNAKNASELDL